MRGVVNLLPWTDHSESNQMPRELKKYAFESCPEDEGVLNWVNMPTKEPVPFTDNTAEYKTRYNPFNAGLYETQRRFFERTLAYCHDNQIEMLLVNMPITQHNVAAMPPGMYQRYLSDVTTAAHKYGVQFVDLNDPTVFQQSDFVDTVHMSGFGALKFWRLLMAHWPA
jgi:hypothetical protein